MLITIMYHRLGKGKHSNSFEMFASHLEYIKDHYPVLLPGDPLPSFFKIGVCLTFDDAYYDFYHLIFPLLQKLNLRALLAVPVKYILETTTVSSSKRLDVPYNLAMQEGIYENYAPYCTWKELEEIAKSGVVEIASHSYSHPNLTYPYLDLTLEIEKSKKMLEERLPQEISTFIYPFGKTDGNVHKKILQHYPYAFRIGSMINQSWDCSQRPLCRISGDNLLNPKDPFSPFSLFKMSLKSILS